MSEETKETSMMRATKKAIIRNWWLYLISVIVCFTAMFLFLRKTPERYGITAMMMVEDQDQSFLGIGNKSSSVLKSITGSGSDANVYNEMEILGSESLAAQLISELGLNRRYFEKVGFMKKEDHYNTSPIVVEAPKELFDTLSIALTFKIKTNAEGKADITVKKSMFKNFAELENVDLPATVKTPYGMFVVKTTPNYVPKHEYDIVASVMGDVLAVEDLHKYLSVKLKAKKTDMVQLYTLDSNTKRGRDILNNLVRLYNDRFLKDKDDKGLNTSNFIDQRLSLIYKDLMGSEAEIEAYKKAHNMLDPEVQVKALLGKELSSENAIIGMETQARIIGMIQSFLSDPANQHALIPFEVDSLSAGSVKAYNNLITQRTRLENSAKGENQALQLIDQQLQSMRTNMLGSVNNSLRALQIKINQAKAVNSKASGQAGNLPTLERETRVLYRNQLIQNEIYIFLLQKREENALRIASTTPRGKVIDAAYATSEPETPKKPLVLFITLFIAMALPSLIVYLWRR